MVPKISDIICGWPLTVKALSRRLCHAYLALETMPLKRGPNMGKTLTFENNFNFCCIIFDTFRITTRRGVWDYRKSRKRWRKKTLVERDLNQSAWDSLAVIHTMLCILKMEDPIFQLEALNHFYQIFFSQIPIQKFTSLFQHLCLPVLQSFFGGNKKAP